MSLTRRQFTWVTSSAVALAVTGCDGSSGNAQDIPDVTDDVELLKKDKKNRHASKLAKEPFLIGPPSRYAEVGVYAQYEEKGVWIVSDAKRLVVLNSTCTHLACATKLDRANEQFRCPCHKSRFDFLGSNQSGSKAKRPLERCALRLVEGQIEVDPTRRFRQEKGQWSDPASALDF